MQSTVQAFAIIPNAILSGRHSDAPLFKLDICRVLLRYHSVLTASEKELWVQRHSNRIVLPVSPFACMFRQELAVYRTHQYRSNGIGAMTMAFGIGRFLDWDFKRAKKSLGFNPNEAMSLEGFPIEKTRLRVFPYVVA